MSIPLSPELQTAAGAAPVPVSHPHDDLLLAYAGGVLGEAKSVLVATHMAVCPVCRTRVEAFESLCGRWMEALPVRSGGSLKMDVMLKRILSGELTVPEALTPVRHVPRGDGLAARVPRPLRDWQSFAEADRTWDDVAPGVSLSTWAVERGGTRTTLLRMAPGAPVPAHRHTATEMLLVLQGAYADDHGRHGPGDVIIFDADTEHHATGIGDEDCICLFLLDGPIEFLA